MSSPSAMKRFGRKLTNHLIRRVASTCPSDRLIRAMSVPARLSRPARSTLIHVALEHAQPGWRSLDLVNEFGSDLPVLDFMSALTAGRRELTRPRIALLSTADRPRLPHLEYVHAVLERRFIDAFDMWKEFPAVEGCLDSLPMPRESAATHSMAVVLPGPAGSDHGREIDSHDFVSRTGLMAPVPREAQSVGTRFDYAFVNWNRFEEITKSKDAMRIDADRIVTYVGLRNRPKPSWLTSDVEFELERVRTPTCPRTYMPLLIVPWCLNRGIRPTLYCADFYLGSTSYQSPDYDSMRLLETEEDHILSYLRHDVFFNHAALRHWYVHGAILARGRLAELLELDGRSFAEVLNNRWGSR